jgi:hypothetical protein
MSQFEPPPAGGSVQHEAKVQETRQGFSENKERAIALLQSAIRMIEEEITTAEPVITAPKKSQATPVNVPDQQSKSTLAEVRPPSPSTWGGFGEVLRRQVGGWWRGRNR